METQEQPKNQEEAGNEKLTKRTDLKASQMALGLFVFAAILGTYVVLAKYITVVDAIAMTIAGTLMLAGLFVSKEKVGAKRRFMLTIVGVYAVAVLSVGTFSLIGARVEDAVAAMAIALVMAITTLAIMAMNRSDHVVVRFENDRKKGEEILTVGLVRNIEQNEESS